MPKRPTSADVALAAGVSRTTVSFVLNGRQDVKIPLETRERVLAAAERARVPPACARPPARRRTLAHRRTRPAPDARAGRRRRRPGRDAAWLRVGRACGRGFRVMVEPLAPDGPHSTYTDLLRAQHADGLVVSGPRIDDRSLLELVRDGFPIVLQGSLPDVAVSSVDVDNVAGSRGAVEHLIALGHRRIACITNAPLVYTAARDRLAGYREALKAAGIDARPGPRRGGRPSTPPSGHTAMAGLLATTLLRCRVRRERCRRAGRDRCPARGRAAGP